MERRRRIIRDRYFRYFDSLTAEQQVSHIIENWNNEIWTPTNAKVGYVMPIDFEYRDDYFIPRILEEVRGTEYEKYIDEIRCGYSYFKYGF